MISDEFATYQSRSQSHLTPLGYYHFYVNHSQHYTHELFTFVQTNAVEKQWARIKAQNRSLVTCTSLPSIQQYCD